MFAVTTAGPEPSATFGSRAAAYELAARLSRALERVVRVLGIGPDHGVNATFDRGERIDTDRGDGGVCIACGRSGTLDRVSGAPFCSSCVDQGCLSERFSEWDDLGRGAG